jgi:hypothetical protein
MKEAGNARKTKPMQITTMDRENRSAEGIQDLDIQALVDGELDRDAERRLLAEIIRSPDLLARLEELLHQKKQVRDWWSFFRKD